MVVADLVAISVKTVYKLLVFVLKEKLLTSCIIAVRLPEELNVVQSFSLLLFIK